MKLLRRWFNRRVLVALAALGCIQIVGFIAFVVGFEAVTVAVAMGTVLLVLVVAVAILLKVNTIARTVTAPPTEPTAPTGGTDDRAEYISRRLLAAFEQERLETQIRFEHILRSAGGPDGAEKDDKAARTNTSSR